MSTTAIAKHKVVSLEEGQAARKVTPERDALASERRALPGVKVAKDYVLDTPSGQKSLAGLCLAIDLRLDYFSPRNSARSI